MRTILAAGGVTTVLLAAGSAPAQDTREQIWSIRIDGTGLRNLSRGGRNDFSPAVSRDGRRIAFVRDGNQLWVMNSDGTGLRTIARRAQQAAWSPDGKRIAYAGDSANSQVARTIDVANADGTHPRKVFSVRRLRHTVSVILPRWSPDGRLVSFLADGPNGGFFSARPDGSHLRRLPRGFVSWSPRGRRILLTRAKGLAVVILVARLDGSHARPLVTLPSGFESLDWTPDGRRVIYTAHG